MSDRQAESVPPATEGRVLSVNVGAVREIRWRGTHGTSAIWKAPVAGRVAVRGINLEGDAQADRRVHGGPDKAVYAYAREDGEWWEAQLGRAVEPGGFGENLTLAGVAVTEALIGERWQIGTTVLEVSQPRVPCWKLGVRMGASSFPQRFAAAGRPGAYLRIVEEGDVSAGDSVRIVHRPGHGVTVGLVARAYHEDHSLAPALLAVPELAAGWHGWARRVQAAGRRARAQPR
jgi:MOSC domain-containing protein YiiM